MVRNSHRCGYVEVPKGHPLFGVRYSEQCKALTNEAPEDVFRVHGGLTYSDADQPYPVTSDGWWFGFDCAHYEDKTEYFDGEERSAEYVVSECESLARQIVEAVKLQEQP